tara:strand:- start:3080 stop:3367 length:288 start_codon:yes stop_codon:yes gene_type:complete
MRLQLTSINNCFNSNDQFEREKMDTNGSECITIIAKEFTPAAMEYHRQRMAEKGFTIDTPIVKHLFFETDGLGKPKALFEGEVRYSATFVKNKVK